MSKTEADTKTEKGAPSLSTTTSARLDLFFGGLVRNAPSSKLRTQTRASWRESPEDTIALLLHARDARKGKGERKVVMACLLWLRKHYPKTYLANLDAFVGVGYYKDLLQLALGAHNAKLSTLGGGGEGEGEEVTEGELPELKLLAAALKADLAVVEAGEADEAKEDDEALKAGEGGKGRKKQQAITLASKWAPSEKGTFDKQAKLAKRLATLMFPGSKHPRKQYRQALGKLRARLKVVERAMCLGEWSAINFNAVPSKAHKNLKGAFSKHQESRYKQYLEDLAAGKEGVKINTAGLQPHELVTTYLNNRAATEDDPTTEAQWETLVEKLRAEGTFDGSLAVVDVSGSMSGTPMEVAIALGLVVAELSKPPFKGKLLTFDANPTWHSVRGGSLREKVHDVARMPWGMTTNVRKVFELILAEASSSRVRPEDMPKTLYIFSDMQFDAATNGQSSHETTHAWAVKAFAAKGLALPQIVYWNLRGDTADFPASADTPGVAMVSGFSAELLRLFLAAGELTPAAVMRQAIAPYQGLVTVVAEERQQQEEGERGGEDVWDDKDLDDGEKEESDYKLASAAKRRKVTPSRPR